MQHTKPSIIESMITCSLCNRLIDTPMQCMQCEQSYCKTCIDNWTITNSSSLPLQCPSKCPKPIYQSSRVIRDLIALVSNTPANKQILFKDSKADEENKNVTPKTEFDQKYQCFVSLYKRLTKENIELKRKERNSHQFMSILHPHMLAYIFVNRNCWSCNGCEKIYTSYSSGSYYCIICDFDLCFNCRINELESCQNP